MTCTPVFIFSLPRSGSTLLQRILAGHLDISTASETWILLPLVYSLKKQGTFAQYSHTSYSNALKDVLEQMPNGKDDYYESIRLFVSNIYSKLNKERTKYFLDKTPRYYLIIEEISKIFPEAKFIFLFRHPLSVMASMINSFYQGRLGDWRHKIDLFEGPIKLLEGYKKLNGQSISIQYESLLIEPETQLKKICDFLEITYDDSLIKNFNQTRLKGSMGDQTGTRSYNRIEVQTLEKWKETLGTPLRKIYAKYYLKKIGAETLLGFGYDMDQLLLDLESIHTRKIKLAPDIMQLILCELRIFFELPLLKRKIKSRINPKTGNYPHY